MSNSVQPYGLQPARLLRSCDSPSKNTGVGSHFLLQGIFPHPGVEPNLYSRWIPYHLSHQGSPFHNIFTCQIICSPPETNIILYFKCFNLLKKKQKQKLTCAPSVTFSPMLCTLPLCFPNRPSPFKQKAEPWRGVGTLTRLQWRCSETIHPLAFILIYHSAHTLCKPLVEMDKLTACFLLLTNRLIKTTTLFLSIETQSTWIWGRERQEYFPRDRDIWTVLKEQRKLASQNEKEHMQRPKKP